MFDRRIKKINESSLYKILLKMALSEAHKLDPNDDYYKFRDEKNNGWDFFYFGFANKEQLKKKCYAKSVNKGTHGEFRIYFTEDDSKKILDLIKRNNTVDNYQRLLKMVLSQTHQLDPRYDYCQLRDTDNNGWDLFYFGFANKDQLTKKCYIQRIDNGAHSQSRIYFTDEDSQKILDSIKENNNLDAVVTIRFD